MAEEKRYETLTEFWPVYLADHADATNRALHFVGTTAVFMWVALAIHLSNPWLLIGAPLNAYGLAWFGHFIVEKNRPATFTYPFKSLACDFIMYFYMFTGQIGSQLQKHSIAHA